MTTIEPRAHGKPCHCGRNTLDHTLDELDACATPRAGEVGRVAEKVLAAVADREAALAKLVPQEPDAFAAALDVATKARFALYDTVLDAAPTLARYVLARAPIDAALAEWVEAQRAFLAGEGGVARADAADAALLAAHAALVKP